MNKMGKNRKIRYTHAQFYDVSQSGIFMYNLLEICVQIVFIIDSTFHKTFCLREQGSFTCQ